MKKISLMIITMIIFPFWVKAQNGVSFEFIRGIEDSYLKSTMETQVVNLLTMLNEAQSNNKKSLKFSGINIADEARQTILQLWNYQHMRVWQDIEGEEPYIAETCLKFGKNGYQVRNIPMRLNAVDGKKLKNDYTEICINFDGNGKIVDFNVAMEKQQYMNIIKNSKSVEDEYNRKMLIHWMDQLRTAYNERNKSFFETIFSEDAIIITGVRKFKTAKTDVRLKDEAMFEYSVRTKKEYLNNLYKIFDNSSYINVTFGDDAEYRRNGGAPRYYSVDVTQYWDASGYSDVGHLFVLWDFQNPEEPRILVRAWQHLDDQRKITFKDFHLPK